MNFASPQVGPIFKQLYVREAMQRLINQPGTSVRSCSGYGNPTYGPVPLVPSSQFVSSAQKQNPYPYDPTRGDGAAARARLEDRARRRGRVRPAGHCAGRVRGRDHVRAKLSFSAPVFDRHAGRQEEVDALQSAFCQAGIQVAPDGAPFDTVVGRRCPLHQERGAGS